MCLIAFALNEHPEYPFILIANRDEFYERPTAAAHFWPDDKPILAGRDLKAGGTWLAINRSGRLAALTNYRDIKNNDPEAKSRGEIIPRFLASEMSAAGFLQELKMNPTRYNGYNLLTYSDKCVHHYSNYEGEIHMLSKGVNGLSNALLNTPWKKVEKVKSRLKESLKKDISADSFFEILADTSTAGDGDLPQTGLPYAMEKAVSAICIRTENYGTCCSTVVLINSRQEVTFIEKTYAVGKRVAAINKFTFQLG